MLYRAFSWDQAAAPTGPHGPLYVPRERQGTGRHDNPDHYGAMYVSLDPVSAVAERLAAFRGQEVGDEPFALAGGRVLALAAFDDSRLPAAVDLDDPTELAARGWRPSQVARRDRRVTQPIALRLFEEERAGFAWWSTLDAAWSNVTLFAERAVPLLALDGEPRPLSAGSPEVVDAADALGVGLRRRALRRVK